MTDAQYQGGLSPSVVIGGSGTHAARPTPTTTRPQLYYEEDTGLTYFWDAVAWQTVQPGQELGYSEITASSFVTSASAGARGDGSVPLTLSSVVVGARPIMLEFDADKVQLSADQDIGIIWFMRSPAGAGTWTDIGSRQVNVSKANGAIQPARRIRQSLAAGSYDFKIQLAEGTAGNSITLFAGPGGNGQNGPAYLRAVAG